MVDWTDKQREAIETRGSRLLVSAAAGSGKTAVLVARIIDMMMNEKVDIDQMLIVTFTRAAAAEMREKILRALTDRLDSPKTDRETAEFLRRQMNRLNRASIQTLHGFCIEVIRAGFHVVDIDPEFRIADDLERNMLRDEALSELLEENYAVKNMEFVNLIEAFSSNKDDEAFKSMIKSFYSFSKSMPEPWDWMRESVAMFGQSYQEFLDCPWVREIREQLVMDLTDIVSSHDVLIDILREPDGPIEYEDTILSDKAIASGLLDLAKRDLEAYTNRILKLETADFVRRKSVPKGRKDEIDPEKDEFVKSGRDLLKKRIMDLRTKYFDASLKLAYEDLKKLKPDLAFLAYLSQKLDECYLEKKAERRLMDFNDLEHFALEILKDERMASRFREKYTHIFIDEYQDNNSMQESIIGLIERKNNVFMVGDVKQSIYRFRLAEPGIFISKYHEYGNEQSQGKRIVLNKNFRSRKTILESINFIFSKIMNTTTGEIEYDEDAKLNSGKEFLSDRSESVEIHMLEKAFDADNEFIDNEIAELNHAQAEAVLVARLIKRLMTEETYDPNTKAYRPIEYRDIVLLSRAAKNWADIFYEVLNGEGIPVYTDDSGGYFDTLEIKLLLDLLKLIDNRRQDLPLLSVLRSPVGGFTIEEMTQVRLKIPKGSYHEAVETYRKEIRDNLTEKLSEFYIKIDKWSSMSRYMKLDDFLWTLVVESGYLAYVSAMPGGIRRRENLKVLMDRASALSKGTCSSIFEFIRFIEDVLKSRGDMDTATVLGEKDNVVRMMTVHKSKGLEFPIVIMTGLGKRMKKNVSKNDLLMHRNLGMGPKFYDIGKRVFRESLPQKAIKLRSFKESVAEEMRILYVAMTRASDRLLLVGSVKNAEKEMVKWSSPITDYSIIDSETYFDWIMAPLSLLMTETDKLATVSGREVRLFGGDHKWKIKVYDRSSLSVGMPQAFDPSIKKKIEDLDFDAKPELLEKLDKTLSWRYAYAKMTGMPSKMTVTLLNRLDAEKTSGKIGFSIPTLAKAPEALLEKLELSPVEIGNLYHGVMQKLVLEKALTKSEQEIERQIIEMVKNDLIAKQALDFLDFGKIKSFLESPLGSRLMHSDNINREVPFILRKKVEEVIEIEPSLRGRDYLLVQGVIDCYFEEDGEWVLLDYKTGGAWRKGLELAAETYKTQLLVYREAIEKITGKKVKEAYLYFMDAGEEVRVL